MTVDGVPGSGESPRQTTSDLEKTTGKPVSKQTWKSTMTWIVAVIILGTMGTVLKVQWNEELEITQNSYDYAELPQATYKYPWYME